MTTNPYDWLKQQLVEAQRDLEAAESRVKTWTDAIKLVEKEKKQTKSDTKPPAPRNNKRVTVKDLVVGVLEDYEGLTAAEIFRYVQDRGEGKGTLGSVTVHLYRHKDKLYRINDEHQWCLIEKEKNE